MSLMVINNGGYGTGVSFAQGTDGPATPLARVRRGSVAVAGDLPTRRAGAQQLT
jgi:hypothetical protein